jgi:hypothetical protein
MHELQEIHFAVLLYYSQSTPVQAAEGGDTTELERIMTERRPTAINRDEMLDMMARTRGVWRSWIEVKGSRPALK